MPESKRSSGRGLSRLRHLPDLAYIEAIQELEEIRKRMADKTATNKEVVLP